MKKQILIIRIVVLFSLIGLSGCTKTNQRHEVIGDIDKVEITNYEVSTRWAEFNKNQIVQGFFHSYPQGIDNVTYDVKGTIKNIAGKYLGTIRITVLFCDANNSVLSREINTIRDLLNEEKKEFHVNVVLIETLNFDRVEKVKFEISVP